MTWAKDATHDDPADQRGLPVNIFFSETGNGAEPHSYTGNYSVTPKDISYIVPRGTLEVNSLLVTITDATSFNQADYGAIAGGLTNGIKFFIVLAGTTTEIPLFAGHVFKHNYDFLAIFHDTLLTSFAGGAQTLALESDLKKVFGIPLVLQTGDRIIVRLNDDLTGLISHTFVLGCERFLNR
ncbi:MAG: hypothetical protein WC465_04920 [Patescibacteria group bacterium]